MDWSDVRDHPHNPPWTSLEVTLLPAQMAGAVFLGSVVRLRSPLGVAARGTPMTRLSTGTCSAATNWFEPGVYDLVQRQSFHAEGAGLSSDPVDRQRPWQPRLSG